MTGDGDEVGPLGRRRFVRLAGGTAVVPVLVDETSAMVSGNRTSAATGAAFRGPAAKPGQTDPEIRWTAEYDGRVRMRRSGDVLLVFDDDDLYGVDAIDGTVRWKKENFASRLAPAIVLGGTVYVTDRSSTVHAVDPGTGRIHWSIEGYWPMSIGAGDERVAIGSRRGEWIVLDDEDGSVEASGSLYGGPVLVSGLDDGTLYAHAVVNEPPVGGIALEGRYPLHAISLEDGGTEWTFDEPVRGARFDGEMLYATTDETPVTALTPETGQQQWKLADWYSEHDVVFPVLQEGSLFVAGWDHLSRLDPETGERQWTFRTAEAAEPLFPWGSDDGIVLTTRGGEVIAIDVETGNERWSHRLDGYRANLLVENGVVYAGAAGEVRAYDLNGSERWSQQVDGPDGGYDELKLAEAHGVVCILNGKTVTALDVNGPPDANFDVEPASPTTADTVTLLADASDRESPADALTYEWDLDDGTEATGRSTERTFESPGSHDVTLTVADPIGAADTVERTIDVEPTPTSTTSPTPEDELVHGFDAGLAATTVATIAGLLARSRD